MCPLVRSGVVFRQGSCLIRRDGPRWQLLSIIDQKLASFARRPIVRWAGLCIGIVLFVLVALRAWGGRTAVSTRDVEAAWLVASFAFLCLGEVPAGAGLAGVVTQLGTSISAALGIRIHFLTAPTRVLPGFFGSTIGRVGLGARYGLRSRELALASLVEPVVSAAIAVVLGLVFLKSSISSIKGELGSVWQIAVLAAVIGVVALLTFLLWSARSASGDTQSTIGLWSRVAGFYVAAWVLFGASLSTLGAGVGGESLNLGEASAVFAVSWLIGFVVIVVPGGLGIREGVMTLLLAPTMGPDLAATVAVLSRLMWWAATGVVFLVGPLIARSEVEGAQEL